MKKLILIPLLFLSFAQAEKIQCKVTSVLSGDSFTCLLNSKEKIGVKLFETTSPPLKTFYGEKSKMILTDMVQDKNVYLHQNQILTERYAKLVNTGTRMIVADVYLEPNSRRVSNTNASSELDAWVYVSTDETVNDLMIQQGYAYFEPFYRCGFGKEQDSRPTAQKEASEAKRGLWADPNLIPPWEWRK